ncbi:MAG: hypothetical protein IPL59_17545 [Candidatus Competibacteraceae bacterium]|nr:hypothetical protein [Candidatus Competibacteraceae bacterium]
MEAWYPGDLNALADAYACPRLARLTGKAKYRNPDAIPKPAAEIEKLLPEFQKQTAARRMGARLSENGNHSRSFPSLLSGGVPAGNGDGYGPAFFQCGHKTQWVISGILRDMENNSVYNQLVISIALKGLDTDLKQQALMVRPAWTDREPLC